MEMNGTSANVSIHVTDETRVTHHVDHGDGTLSLCVGGDHGEFWTTASTYLIGSPDGLRAFAAAITRAVVVREAIEHNAAATR